MKFNKIDTEYDLPEIKEAAVDNETGEIVDLDSLSHWEKIVLAAKDANITLREPKHNCKKCYGRGYVGINTKDGVPVVCSCALPKKEQNELINIVNRKMRRDYMRMLQSGKIKMTKPKQEKQVTPQPFVPVVETVNI